MGRRTIKLIVKDELNYKSYVLKRRHLLTVPLVARLMPSPTDCNPFNYFAWGIFGEGGEQQALKQKGGLQGHHQSRHGQHRQGRGC